MKIPLQITFRHMEPSEALEAKIREKAEDLERFVDYIMRCRVTVEAPHQHHRQGKLYNVKIDITLPGEEIIADRHPAEHLAHEDVYVALRDAFNAARRQLEDYARKRRGKVKTHETPPHGQIKILVPDEDYGMIAASDGRDVYFHRNSVIDMDFDKLAVGDTVHFNEEMGEKGPQATTVHVEGKHHIIG
ncbi:MAG: HPF/RaiA family ribosome-associated protein [Granulosicoccaceae bacterium]|jgi:ribosomal subunit interface protein